MAIVKKVGQRGKLHVEFDSVPEVFRVIDKLNWTPQHAKSSNTRKGSGFDNNFYTFNDLEHARRVFEHDPDSIRGFDMNDSKLVSRESPGKDVEYDVTGDFLDIDRYLEGIPEVFGNAVMGNPKSVFCTVNILGSFVYYTKPAYIIQKQKRVLRLVDWLETQNIRCQIVVTEDSTVSYSSVTVKEFADPFDLNHLAVAMHPDWLRRIMFLIMEQSNTWSSGYGSSLEYDKRMQAYKPNPEDGLYVYVGGYMPSSIEDMDSEFDAIEDEIQKMIDEERTWCDVPLQVTGGTKGW